MPLDQPRDDLHRARDEFVGQLSREFRTSLSLLLGPLEHVLDSPASALAPGARGVLEAAQHHALRLLTLLDAVPVPRENGGQQAESLRSSIDLAAYTAALVADFRAPCDAAGLGLIVDCPPLRDCVHVDPDGWAKIVINLVAHAATATIEGTIQVRLRIQDGHAQLTVADAGPGIPPDELPYVFDDRVTRARIGSDRAGFGLPFVRDLVRRHHGSVDVRSTAGLGSTYTVVLPLGAGDVVPGTGITAAGPAAIAPPVAAVRAETAARSSARGHVVVAEDHPETRLYLSHVLETTGFVVDAVADGAAALSICQTCAPDALVSDVRMPGLNGFALIERLRADERTAVIPVLLLSAHGGEESRIDGIAAGADGYLVKPLSRRELVARVDGAVRLARLRRETALREQERIRALSGRLVEVQEAERRELSAELHDRTSPRLAAIQINLDMISALLRESESSDLRALLDDTAGLIAETTASIREISSNLRPTLLDDGGLLPALTAYAQQFTRRTGIAVQLNTQEATVPLSPAVESGLFRIIQEALTNCAKHAKAATVVIRMSAAAGDLVSLLIADDGVGFDAARQITSGLGLVTMRERAEFLGGRFTLDTSPDHGTRIRVVVRAS